MQRTLLQLFLTGVLAAIPFAECANAAGLFAVSSGAAAPAGPQWPVLRDSSGASLGLHGGRASAYALDGRLYSAALLILPTGYTAPVFSDGALATLSVAYFDRPGCKGKEYLAPSGDDRGLLPFPGLIYRSAATGQVMQIAQGTATAQVTAQSRLRLGVEGIRCEPTEAVLPLLAAELNAPAVTGMNREGSLRAPIGVAVETGTGSAAKPLRRPPADEAGSASDDRAPTVDEEPQHECSPGCLDDSVGNGLCDIPCFFESCRYDGGDCATMDKDALDQALANMCSPGCNREDVGDGFCDVACQTAACGQDEGDCDVNDR